MENIMRSPRINIKKARNFFIYFLSILASFFGIALNFVLARFLEAEQFGKLQYLVALATTISQFLILGMNTFLIREAKNEKHNGEIINKCFSLYFIIVLFFLPIIFFVLKHYVLSTYTNTFLAIAITIMSLMMGLNVLITSYFQGSGKLHLSIIFENLIPKFTLLLISIVFIYLNKTQLLQESYIGFYILIYSFVSIPFSIYLFKKINLNFSKEDIKTILFFFGITVTYSLGNNLTKVLQGGLYKDDVVLGTISVAISIVSLVNIFTSVLDNIIRPIFAKQKRENNIQHMIETYRFETRVNMYISMPLFLFFMINPDKFLNVFGNSYLTFPNILIIIAASSLINCVTGSNGILLAMTGKEKWELFNGILYFAVYFICVFAFSWNKVYGLSFALLASQIVVNAAKYLEVWIIYKKQPLDWKSLLTLVIVGIANFIIIYALRYVNVHLILWFAIGVICGISMICLNFFLFSLYRKQDFKTLINLRL